MEGAEGIGRKRKQEAEGEVEEHKLITIFPNAPFLYIGAVIIVPASAHMIELCVVFIQ